MLSFGSYETVSEICRTGFVIVYRARLAAGGKDDFAVKVFQPIALLAEAEQAKYESELFRSKARTQQLVQTKGGGHWAPIHQCDSTDEGAFYVTDYYDHSLQQLIDGHVKPSAGILHKIVESVALGLVELKQACNRPHGNLKATNVLVAQEAKPADLKIVLSDPLPDEHIKKYHWTDDLRAVGELIYQLIMHRSAPAAHGWKVAETDEWKTLGRQAKHWMDLCNRLLSAPAKPDAITLEALIEELARLKKLRSAYLRRWIIAAGLMVAAGVVAYLVYGYITRRPPDVIDWDKACVGYIAWVGQLESKVKSNWQEKDPHLKKIVKQIEAAAYPSKVAGGEGMDVKTVRSYPDRAGTGKTTDALEAINDIKRYLKPSSANNSEGWPLLGKIDQLAEKVKNYGFTELARSFQDIIDSVQPPENRPGVEDDDIKENSRIADNINIILASKDILQNICASVDKLDEDKASIEAAGEPFTICGSSIKSGLSNLAKAVKDTDIQYDEEDNTLSIELDTLSQDSQKLKNKVEALAVYITGPAKNRFRKKLFLNDFKSLNITSKSPLEKWLSSINLYIKIKNPIEDTAWQEIRDDLERKIKDLEAERGFVEKGAEFRDTLTTFDDSFEKFPQILEKNNLYLINRDSPKINEILDNLERQLHDFQQKVSIEFSKLVPPKEWLAIQEQELKFTDSDILQQTWSRMRNNILSEDIRRKLQQDDRNQLQEIREHVENLYSGLQKIDNKRKDLDQKFGDLPTPQNRNIDLKSDLRTAYKQAREKVFRRIIEQFPPGKVLDITKNKTDDSDAFTPKMHNLLNTFSSHGDDLFRLTENFYGLNKSFEDCYLFDDNSVRESSDEFISLHNDLKNQTDLKDIFIDTSRIQTKYQNLIGRIVKLEEIMASNDRAYLAQTAGHPDSQTETIYAAWKRLGEMTSPPWPGTDEGDTEERIRDILSNRFQNISDASRSNELINELSSVAKERQKILGSAIAANLTARLKDGLDRAKSQAVSCKVFDAFVEYAETNMQQYNADLSALEPEDLTLETLKTRSDGLINNLKVLVDSANLLAAFLQGAEWNNDSAYRKDLFIKSIDKAHPEEILTTLEWTTAIQGWESEFAKYKKLDDPRGNITDDIDSLGEKIKAEKDPEKRKNLKDELAVLAKDLENSRRTFPAIVLYREQIDDYFAEFEDRLRGIKNELKPDYCKYIEFFDGQVRFASEYESLLKNFEPVLAPDFEPAKASDFKPLTNDQQWLNLKTKGNSLIDKFFHVTENAAAEDVGLWPKYVSSKKYSTVIFRFIPHGNEPFYMAIREVTNAQYARFLQETGATTSGLYIKDTSGKPLIRKAGNPPCAIKWKKSTSTFVITAGLENAPITGVTFNYGAKSYAAWLGTELPTTSQHRYACQARADTIYPWGKEQSKMSEYVHLRGPAWKDAANTYNENRNKTLTDVALPLGAVEPKGFKRFNKDWALSAEDDQYFSEGSEEHIWPYDTSSTNTKPNDWGLYDMIGNAWEWCKSDDTTKSAICGFSCLTPKEYIIDIDEKYVLDGDDKSADYEHDFKKPNNDIGFRVIFSPAKLTAVR